MDRLRQDLIVSLRRLRKSPGFTIAVIGLIAVVAFSACWFPARKAITVDPVRSLRIE